MSGTLRRRRIGGDGGTDDDGERKKGALSLESFDLYAKPEAESVVQTSAGAGVSLLTVVLVALLVLSELWGWLAPRREEHMMVDPVVEGRLRINFDLTLHALPCGAANVDVMDVTGEQQNGVDHDLIKTRLRLDGTPIEEGQVVRLQPRAPRKVGEGGEEAEPAGPPSPTPLPSDYCGSCYGAEPTPGSCCNTCDSVRAAYAERGWDTGGVLRSAEQCIREGKATNTAAQGSEAPSEEGCHVRGYLLVNKVAGNFHIALGETHERGAGHIHQFNPSALFNVSHTIHSLSFGHPYPGMTNPLDGSFRSPADGGTGTYMFSLKVIPTRFYGGAGWTPSGAAGGEGTGAGFLDRDGALVTNQYSASVQYRPAVVNGQRQNVLPGLFFVYEISPFQVTVSEARRGSLSSFLTGLLAILGGVLSLARLTDALLFALGRAVKRAQKAGAEGGAMGVAAAGVAAAAGSMQRAVASASSSLASPLGRLAGRSPAGVSLGSGAHMFSPTGASGGGMGFGSAPAKRA